MAVHVASRANGGVAPMRLLLAYGFQSLMSIIVFLEPRGDASRTVMFWLMGSLGGANWAVVPIAAVALALVLAWNARQASALDVMTLGDASALSSGVDCERQRVMLALALAQDCPVLALDEPTNQIDLRHQYGVVAHTTRSERTALVALHDLNLAAAVCDSLTRHAGEARRRRR